MMYQVRDGKRVAPTCPECGCRIFFHRLWGISYYAHKLNSDATRDARGHDCPALHDWWNEENYRGVAQLG